MCVVWRQIANLPLAGVVARTEFDLAAPLAPAGRGWADYPAGVIAGYQALGFAIPGFDAAIAAIRAGGVFVEQRFDAREDVGHLHRVLTGRVGAEPQARRRHELGAVVEHLAVELVGAEHEVALPGDVGQGGERLPRVDAARVLPA